LGIIYLGSGHFYIQGYILAKNDFFIALKPGLNIEQNSKRIENPILYATDPNPEIYFLVDTLLKGDLLKNFKLFMKNRFKEVSYAIVYCFEYVPTEKELSRNLKYFFWDHSVKLSEIILPHSKVIAIGRAIHATTFDTDITVQSFNDWVWNKTHFYSPFIKSEVFPVDSIFQWYSLNEKRFLDNVYRHFLMKQIDFARRFSSFKKRIPSIEIEEVQDVSKFLNDFMGPMKVSIDSETSGLDWLTDYVGCITLSFDGRKGYFLDAKDIPIDLFTEFLKDKYIIGTNFKFDRKFFKMMGIRNLKVDFDTWHAGHTLNEMRSNSLKTHAFVYTLHGGYDLELEKYKRKNPKVKYTNIPRPMLVKYATMDAIVAFQTHEAQLLQFEEDPDLYEFFLNYMMPSVNTFAEIEEEGVYVNWNKVEEAELLLSKEIDKIRNEIYQIMGEKINIDSGPILGEFLEKKMCFPVIERAKKSVGGYYLTNRNCLEEWSKLGFKLADLLIDYSTYKSIKDTFIGNKKLGTGIWQHKRRDGKVYPVVFSMLARSMRNRYRDPNLQNIPHHHEILGPMIRSIFDVPSDEFILGDIDYSGLQLRIGAMISGDKNMADAFINLGGDIHSMTAQQTFHPFDMTLEEFMSRKKEHELSEERFMAKQVNFKFEFGGGAYGLYY